MFISTRECAKQLKISIRRVQALLAKKRIQGAYKVGRYWLIPLYDGKPVVSAGRRGPASRWSQLTRQLRQKNMAVIYVSRATIRENQKENTFKPVISVHRGNGNASHAHEIRINGPSMITYSEKAMCSKGGSRVWLETYHEVELFAIDGDTKVKKSIGFL